MVVIVVVVLLARRFRERPIIVRSSAGSTPSRANNRSNVARKPRPVSPGFEGCPGEGDGGDRALNRLKNRVDTAEWVPMDFATIINLSWPRFVVRRARDNWTLGDAITVAETEGLPVAVEGYLAGAKVEAPEATNCHGAQSKFRDWHLWLAATPGKDRRRSIVVETTPAVRARHPEWSIMKIHGLVRDSAYVRVSGWLMLDPEHPDQIGKTRGTLWEIHPVMRIEVRRAGGWVPLGASADTSYPRPNSSLNRRSNTNRQ